MSEEQQDDGAKPATKADVRGVSSKLGTLRGTLDKTNAEYEAINNKYIAEFEDEDNANPEDVPKGEQQARVRGALRKLDKAEDLLAKPVPTKADVEGAKSLANEAFSTIDDLGVKKPRGEWPLV
ncbi:hypothetical protein [Ramlibacter alkalitolerans]|uniref:Uncharacterized protein n=1 Tax=Ramlibacter alkalitolerans TaxID=2039631 RepID=A0ABS1JU36_9BURK|nr:hypothetical protein [Ramlibacter alkalitolerans]MBL0427686.1 hypothetical protein [Ramlibacter alkalitolerans]